jgi:RNA polymerase sigma-70 factor, ECF subfamily
LAGVATTGTDAGANASLVDAASSRTLRSMDATDDGQLMLRYRDGDVVAFEQLYARHRGNLFRYLARQLGDREAAADVFQEVWSRVIATRMRYEVRASFAAFLYSIAHNCIADHYRRLGRRPADRPDADPARLETLASSESWQPDAKYANTQTATALRRALAALPREQRDVFLLYEESALGLQDIARITGVGVETAKSRLRYALGKLREALEPQRELAGGSGT